MEPSEVIQYVTSTLEHLGIEYAITGSYASIIYGDPRTTYDIDILICVNQSHVNPIVVAFPEDSYYISAQAVKEAIANQTHFNVINTESGLKIDFYPREKSRYTNQVFKRVIRLPRAEGYEVSLISAEDNIIAKMRFYKEGQSERQLRDILGILKKQASKIDKQYISRWAVEFDVLDIWQRLLDRGKSD